jgi:PPOX class probable F420-dependent enzyme
MASLPAPGPREPYLLPPSARRLFASDRHATVVTVNPDGTAQVSMVWIGLDGNDLIFGAEQRRRKIRNLRRDPTVTAVVQDTERAANGLVQYLTVRGRATITGPGIPGEFNALMDAAAQRYLGTSIYPMPNRNSSTAVIVRITPERIGGVGPWAD